MFTFSNIFPCTVSCSYEIYETILLKFRDCVHSIWYCKCCCVRKITAGFPFWGLKEANRLQKKQFNTFHCGGTMYLSIKHSRQYLEMVWLYRDQGNIWYDQTQKSHFSLSGQALLRDTRQSCTRSTDCSGSC